MRDLVSEEVFRIRFRFQAPLDGFSHFSKRGREKEKIDSLLVSYVIPSPHLVLMRGQKESTANLKHPTSTLPPPPHFIHIYVLQKWATVKKRLKILRKIQSALA